MQQRYPTAIVVSALLVSGLSSGFSKEDGPERQWTDVQNESGTEEFSGIEASAREIVRMIVERPEVQTLLDGSAYRLLDSILGTEDEPDEYRLTLYDIDHDRVLELRGELAWAGIQPSQITLLSH